MVICRSPVASFPFTSTEIVPPVVGADNWAQLRTVEVGSRVGTLWVITTGLKPGERVVAEIRTNQSACSSGTSGTVLGAKGRMDLSPQARRGWASHNGRQTVRESQGGGRVAK